MTEEQALQVPQVKEMVDDPPPWLEEWSRQVGAELNDGLREGPGWIAFARENGTVYHTYTLDHLDTGNELGGSAGPRTRHRTGVRIGAGVL